MSSGAGAKHVWNSLELVKLVVAVLLPLAIFVVGQFIAREAEAERKHRADIAAAERDDREDIAAANALAERNEARDRDVTKAFLERLRQADACTSAHAMGLLAALATPERTKELSAVYTRQCPSIDAGFAASAVEASQRATVSGLIGSLDLPGRRVARTELTKAWQEWPGVVGPMCADAVAKNSRNYRITLGVLVVLGSLSAGWNPNGEMGKQFAALADSPNQKDATFSWWYKKAADNKKTSP